MALVVLLAGAAIGYFCYSTELYPNRFKFKLGLDLAGGTQLVYSADTSKVAEGEVGGAMAALRDVIERRVNAFGVAEPVVQVERAGGLSASSEERLIVELPGVTNVDEAVRQIGQTPLLEFKLVRDTALSENPGTTTPTSTPSVGFEDTGLSGALLQRADLQFSQDPSQGGFGNEPIVLLTFNEEGAALFERITTEHTGEPLAIFLDGNLLSAPLINEPITGGQAVVSGRFTPTEARELVKNLNFGALPVPISLASTQTIGASLGSEAIRAGILAGIIGYLAVAAFLIFWYRLPGLIASISLLLYIAIVLGLFKLVPVTLTAAGITGFILSIGMAVDANILIFERLKEELDTTDDTTVAISTAFSRAWSSIRDTNISSILTAIVLFWFGTSLVRGFALTFSIGILASMFTAITISRTLLLAVSKHRASPVMRFLLRCGIS
jgi:preprotein translocase subunit SecD